MPEVPDEPLDPRIARVSLLIGALLAVLIVPWFHPAVRQRLTLWRAERACREVLATSEFAPALQALHLTERRNAREFLEVFKVNVQKVERLADPGAVTVTYRVLVESGGQVSPHRVECRWNDGRASVLAVPGR